MVLFLKVSEVVRDHPDRGRPSSYINLYPLGRFTGTDGYARVGGAVTGSRSNDL